MVSLSDKEVRPLLLLHRSCLTVPKSALQGEWIERHRHMSLPQVKQFDRSRGVVLMQVLIILLVLYYGQVSVAGGRRKAAGHLLHRRHLHGIA